jgi:hypothetical protein
VVPCVHLPSKIESYSLSHMNHINSNTIQQISYE